MPPLSRSGATPPGRRPAALTLPYGVVDVGEEVGLALGELDVETGMTGQPWRR